MKKSQHALLRQITSHAMVVSRRARRTGASSLRETHSILDASRFFAYAELDR